MALLPCLSLCVFASLYSFSERSLNCIDVLSLLPLDPFSDLWANSKVILVAESYILPIDRGRVYLIAYRRPILVDFLHVETLAPSLLRRLHL
jgi:hypothetical protein